MEVRIRGGYRCPRGQTSRCGPVAEQGMAAVPTRGAFVLAAQAAAKPSAPEMAATWAAMQASGVVRGLSG